MDRRALITGITGFVGPYLARKLVASGFEVYGFFRRRADGIQSRMLTELNLMNDIRLLEGDVTNLTSLLFALDRSRPDVIFHLASQSYIPRSFEEPVETFRTNSLGVQNLLEAVRLKDLECRIVFAGSSEEYGLQIVSQKHHLWALDKYKVVFPEPQTIPELPVREDNPLRPMSPYAVSKVHGDFLARNYHNVYGLKTIVSRAFNHEGAGRGDEFVTSTIVKQCVSLKYKEVDRIRIGDINVFRDWSHVEDIVNGYVLLSDKGQYGDVYVQGSMRTNSVLTYILLTLQNLGYEIEEIETLNGDKKVKNPTEVNREERFGVKFCKTKVDDLMLNDEIEYDLDDRGLRVSTSRGDVVIDFDCKRFRRAEVPILLSETKKIHSLGFCPTRALEDIIRSQTNYYLNPENRRAPSS